MSSYSHSGPNSRPSPLLSEPSRSFELSTTPRLVETGTQEPLSADTFLIIRDFGGPIPRARIIPVTDTPDSWRQMLSNYSFFDHLEGYMRVDQLVKTLVQFDIKYGIEVPETAAWLELVIDRLYRSCLLSLANFHSIGEGGKTYTIPYLELRLALHLHTSSPISIYIDKEAGKSRKTACLWGWTMISGDYVSLSLDTEDGERVYIDVCWLDTVDPGNNTVKFPPLTEMDEESCDHVEEDDPHTMSDSCSPISSTITASKMFFEVSSAPSALIEPSRHEDDLESPARGWITTLKCYFMSMW